MDYDPISGNEIEQDIVTLDFNKGQTNNIYGQPISRTSSRYEYLELPIYLINAQNINEVFVKILYGDDSSDSVYLDVSSEIGKTGMYYYDLKHDINFKEISKIEFDVRFNENATAEILSNENATVLSLGGLALFTPESLGILTVETNSSSYDYEIFPSVFSSPAIPDTVQFDLEFDYESEIIEKLYIKGTEGWRSSPDGEGLYGSNLDLFSISLIENYHYMENVSDTYNIKGEYIPTNERVYRLENRTDPMLLYYFDFDEGARNLHRKMTDWYRPSAIEKEWVNMTKADTFHEKLSWIHDYSLDFDGDANYDLIIEEFDGEGKGDFDNNIQDYIRMDFGADGYWDYQVLFDTQDYLVQVTDPELYGMSENLYGEEKGHYYLSNYKKELIETSIDTDNNGAFDFKSQIFYSMQSFAVPEYRRMEIINHKLVKTGDLFWFEPVQGVQYSVDKDGDGYFEETMERTDRWKNSEWVLDDMYEDMIFETYKYTNDDYDESDNMLIENT
ncbi:MAG: hypothetical protein DRG27_04050, partial [Deltaproteobacteria bacterium]